MDSYSRPFAWFSRASALAISLLMMTAPARSAPPAVAWDLVKIDGRDYVTVDNIRRFYEFTDLTRSGNQVVLLKKDDKGKTVLNMKLSINGNECLMNNVKFIFSQEIVTSGDKVCVSRLDLAKLIDPVLRPSYIQNAGDFKTVILDPGHGGKDPGATNPLGTEAGYNIKVAGMVRKQLEKDGFKVLMTRETDIYQSLQERVDIANSVSDNAIFVSIHFNSGGRSARGVETFTLSPPGVSHYGRDFREDDNQSRAGNMHDSANIALATAIHGSVLTNLANNTIDRGIKRARFSVLSGVRHPAILLEGGFLSHPYEARLIDNEKYQTAIAGAVYKAILKYRAAMTRKVTAPPVN